MPTVHEFNPSFFGEALPEDGGFDPSFFGAPLPTSDALRERLRFNLREDYREEDQGNLFDQALLGMGQGFNSLAGAAGGIASFIGADETGRGWSDYANRSRAEYEDLGDTLGTSPSAQVTRSIASQVAQQVPMIGAGLLSGGSLGVMAGAAGLQSLGSIEDEATQAYQAQGLSREEAVSRARGPAVLGGLITGVLTRAFPGGLEAMTRGLVTGAVTRGTARTLLLNASKEALKEYPEEFADEFAQGVVALYSYDPERPFGEILQQAHDAGALGLGIAGGIGVIPAARGAIRGDGNGNPLARGFGRGTSVPNIDPAVIDEYQTWQQGRRSFVPGAAQGQSVQLTALRNQQPATPANDEAVGLSDLVPLDEYTDEQGSDEAEIPFPAATDPENEERGASMLRRLMGDPEPDEASVPLSQVMRVGQENIVVRAPELVAAPIVSEKPKTREEILSRIKDKQAERQVLKQAGLSRKRLNEALAMNSLEVDYLRRQLSEVPAPLSQIGQPEVAADVAVAPEVIPAQTSAQAASDPNEMMESLQVGDVIVDEDGERKVLRINRSKKTGKINTIDFVGLDGEEHFMGAEDLISFFRPSRVHNPDGSFGTSPPAKIKRKSEGGVQPETQAQEEAQAPLLTQPEAVADAPAAVPLHSASIPETIDTLYHGTKRQFDEFKTDVPNRRNNALANRMYFSSEPDAAWNAANSGKGAKSVDLNSFMASDDELSVLSSDEFYDLDQSEQSQVLRVLREKLGDQIDAGGVVVSMRDNGGLGIVSKDDLARFTPLQFENAIAFSRKSLPRILKAEVSGKTLDITKNKTFPESLKTALKAEGRWDPETDFNSYGHERSNALIDWARAHGYSKIKVRENYETGGESKTSFIVLPEAFPKKFDDVFSDHFGPYNPSSEAQAPVLTPEAVADAPAARGLVDWEAATPIDGVRVRGEYDVIDANDLVTSFDKGFEQSLQSRDRSRAASKNQIAKMATSLDPARLGESPTSDMGAPIIDDKNQVLSGNGRTASIRQAYGTGTAEDYRQFLIANAAKFGVDPQVIAGMKNPVLVRRVGDFGGITKEEFSRQSNQQQVLGMAESETTASDAQMLLNNPQLLDSFMPSEEGDVLAASNRTFLNSFIQGTGAEATLLGRSGGEYNAPVLMKRVKNAVLGALIGPENRQLITALMERADDLGIKNVVNGLMAAAPRLLKTRGGPFDITQSVSKAMQELVRVRSEGTRVEDYLSQSTLFGDPERTAESDFILQRLAEAKSVKAVAGPLVKYVDMASRIDTETGDIFSAALPTKTDLLKASYETQQAIEAQENLTLGKPEQKPQKPKRKASASDGSVPPEQGAGSIYEGQHQGKLVWFVQESEKRGFGDSIWNTKAEAEKSASNTVRRAQDRAKALSDFESQKQADAAIEKEKANFDGFEVGQTPMQVGRLVSALSSKQVNWRGKPISKRDLIRSLVAEGRTIETEDGKRALMTPEGAFVGEKVISKLGMDYAEFLIAKRDSKEQGALGGATEGSTERGSINDPFGFDASRYVVAQSALKRRGESEGLSEFTRRMKLEYFNGLINKSVSEGRPIPEGIQQAIEDLDKVRPSIAPKRDAEWKRLRHLERVDNPRNPYRDSDVAAAKAKIDNIQSKKRPLKEVVYKGDTGKTGRNHIGISVTTKRDVAESYGPTTAYQLDAEDALYFDKTVSRSDFLERGASPEIKTSENPTGQEILEATTKWLKQQGNDSPPAVGAYLSNLGWQAYKMASQSFVFDSFALSNEQASIGGPSGLSASTAPTGRAAGIPAIRALIDQSKLSPDAKFVAQKILDVVEKTGLDPTALALELSEALPGDRAGSIVGSLIRMIESADATVLPHEVAHLLRTLLPEAAVAAIEQARLDNMPADAPQAVIDGTMTTQQFIDASLDKTRPELYPFINLDEYLAHFFAAKFAKEQLTSRDAGLLQRIQTWLKELWEAIKSKFRDPAAMDRIYRDMVSGKYKVTPDTGLKVEQERGSLVTTAKGAENVIEIAQDPMQEKRDGQDMIAQADAPVKILKKFGVDKLPWVAQVTLDFINLNGIATTGERANQGASNYATIRQQSTPTENDRRAGMAAQHAIRFEGTLDDAAKDGEKALLELNSTSIQKRIQKLRDFAVTKLFYDQAFRSGRAAIKTALNEAEKMLRAERGSDINAARLEAQVKALQGVEQSGVAMEQLLADMTTVLNSSPEGQAALAGYGDAREIATLYRQAKKDANQKIEHLTKGVIATAVPNDQLVSVASYLLNKMPDLRDQLNAARLAQSPAVLAQAQGAMKALLDRLKKSPAATLEKIMVEREKRAGNAVEAEFLFFHMQKELSKELEKLYLRVKTGQIANQIKADPDWTTYRDQVFRDQGSYVGKPIEPFQDSAEVIEAPISKRRVGVGSNRIVDSTAESRAAVQEFGEVMQELREWIEDPDNTDDPTFSRRILDLETMEAYYDLHSLHTGKSQLFKGAFSILNMAVDAAGTRHAPLLKTAMGKVDRLKDKVAVWVNHHSPRLAKAQRAAWKSHGYDKRDSADAARAYDGFVFQELSNRAQFALPQVGDVLMSGLMVTEEDIAHLRAMSDAGKELIALVKKYDRYVLTDEQGLREGQTNYRTELASSPFIVPRIPRFELSKAENIVAVVEAFKAHEEQDTPQTLAALNNAFIALWSAYGRYFVGERNSDFARATIFDGAGGAFQALANEIRQSPNSFPTFDSFISRLGQFTNATPDEIRAIILPEFGRIIASWHNAVAQDADAAMTIGGDPTNSFTRGRGAQMAPSPFYRTGWATTGEVMSHGHAATSASLNRVVDGLKVVRDALDGQIEALATRTRELELAGVANPEEAARNEKRLAQFNDKAFSDWESLQARRATIDKAIARLTNLPIARSDFDSMLSRLVGGAIGSLIGNSLTTLRNTSGIYLIRQLQKAGYSTEQAWLQGLRFSQTQAVKMIGSMIVAIPEGGFQFIKGLSDAVPALLDGKGAAEAWRLAFRGVIKALAENSSKRLGDVREMQAAGIGLTNDAVAQFDNQMADMIYRGEITQQKLSKPRKAVLGFAAAIENTALAMANAMFPTIGDAAINSAAWKLEHSSVSHNAVFGRKIRALQQATQSGYGRRFDLSNPSNPTNLITPKELNVSADELAGLRKLFETIGGSFDARAVQYMARLQTDPNAEFLTEQETQNIVEALIVGANRASFSNRPLAFSTWPKMEIFLAPLLNWPVRQMSEAASQLAIPTRDGGTALSIEDVQKYRASAIASVLMRIALTMLIPGALSQLRDEELARFWRYAFYRSRSANKQPWEFDSMGDVAANHVRLTLESVPLMTVVANMIIPQNTPARASYEPSFVVVEKAKDIGAALAKYWKTGEIAGPLISLAEGMNQDLRIVTSRLDSRSGLRERSNTIALLRRFAPEDVVRPRGDFPRVSPNLNELSPYNQRMWNAAFNGDMPELRTAYQEAIAKARLMGKRDPAATVAQMMRGGDPYSAALTVGSLTEQQRREMLAEMAEGQRAQFLAAEKAWADALNAVGLSARQRVREAEDDRPRTSRRSTPVRRYEDTVRLNQLR